MLLRKFLYRVGFLLILCVAAGYGVWFAFYRPIIPNGEIGELQFEERPCIRNGAADGKYDIGVFFVPENRSNPNSRVIAVDYVRFHAKKKSGPPVFLLPGGPGNTYIGQTPNIFKMPQVEHLRKFSDVVLVNQRGYNPRRRDKLGYWKATDRKPEWTTDDEVADYTKFAKQAVAHYENSSVDLSGYNIIECAADVADLRKALGYDRIVLMGQSFGSQWCFAVMRNHPEIVERAILTGVEPLNHTYDMPSHLMNAVRRIWKHIDSAPEWKPFLPPGGMEEVAEEVLSRMEDGGIEVQHKSTGKLISLLGPDDFPWDYPAEMLELFHGSTKRWEQGRGRYFSFNTLIYPLIDSGIAVTEERRQQLLNDPATRYVSRNTSNFASLEATADIWPSPDVGDDFRNPVESDIPVVFVHGDWDRTTPIENTMEIAPYFRKSHTLTIERGGHSPFRQMDELPDVLAALMRFAETGSIDEIPDRVSIKPDLGHNTELPRLDPATLFRNP